MSRAQPIDKSIEQLEYKLAKFKFVKSHFPDVQEIYSDFSSPAVNSSYTDFDFDQGWGSTLSVMPYTALPFIYNGKTEIIKISSDPKRKRLAQVSWRRVNGKNVLKFCKVAINLKADNFKDGLLQSCLVEISTFIQKHNQCHIDATHLDKRLKALLGFI